MRKIATAALLVFAALFVATPALAQEEKGKPNVFIDYFSRPSDMSFVWAEYIRSNVMQGLTQTNRINVIDVDSKEALAVEKSRREKENVVAGEDMNRLKVMTEEGANFIIQGTVTSFTAVRNVNSTDNSEYYTATCAYTLKVIDPNTGKVIHTENFTHGGKITDLNTSSSAGEAAAKTAAYAVKAMRKFVEGAFKIEGRVLEIAATKGNAAKEVYISLGSENGVGPKAYFKVCVKREVAGRTSFKEIGELAVKNVESEDLTLCTVKKGGEEIKQAVDAGQEVIVRSFKKQGLPTLPI